MKKIRSINCPVNGYNNSSFGVSFCVQKYIVRPDGMTVWLSPITTHMDTGETRTREGTYTVPLGAIEGDHIFGVLLSDTCGNEIDNDSFGFMVTSGQ